MSSSSSSAHLTRPSTTPPARLQGATGSQVSASQAEVTWRVQFGIGAAIAAAVTAYRWRYLQVTWGGGWIKNVMQQTA